jgi:tetratricopeptide (TPR) repeat protein
MDNGAATRSGFVGRERERASLVADLDAAASGRGRLFLLGGEPGIGKSRLADETAGLARERGFRVVWGRCWEAGGAPAYWPWVQSLRTYARGLDRDELRSQLGPGAPHVAQVVPEIADALPDLPVPASMEAEADRFRLFEAVATFLHRAGAAHPLMLVLDDLHAADAPSLLLLQFVAGELGDDALLVLGAYRNIELGRDHPLTFALAELSRQRTTTHLTLSGLSEAEVARMIEQSTGVTPSQTVAVAVYRETEGNPLFVNEVVRLFAAEGGLERIDDPATLHLAIPVGIREVIDRRVARLSEGSRTTLELASVFGREFSLEAVGRLYGRQADEALDLLEEATANGLVAEVAGHPGRFRFSHALIRDALYDGIAVGRRVRLHRGAGQTLQALYQPRLEPHLAELAHHFFLAVPAGEVDKAIDYSESAARSALAQLAYEEAVRLFRMALAALESGRSLDERARVRLLLAVGDALDRAGDRQGAKGEFLRAAEIARRERLAEELAEAALAYGGRFMFARWAGGPPLTSLLEDARVALADNAGPLRARVLARLAAAMRDQSDRGPRDLLSREAVELARSFSDPPTLAYALAARWAAIFGPDQPEEQLALGEELRATAREAGDKERAVEAEVHSSAVLLELGRIAEYREAIDAAGVLADELRQPAQRWFVTAAKANLALLEGRSSEAEMHIEAALRFGRRSHPFEAIACSRIELFALRREDGRLGEMEQELRRSLHEYRTRPVFGCLLAALFAELDDMDQSRAVFEGLAAAGFSDIPLNNDFLLSTTLLVEVAAFVGDTDRAVLLYDLLLPYRGLVVDTFEWSTGAVDRYLGLAAETAGDPEGAIEHLRAALELNTRLGALPFAARSERDLARLLRARDAPGDRDKAIELQRAALETAGRLGMATTAARIREELFADGPGEPERVGSEPALAGGSTPAVFRREGEYWSIALEGEAFRLRDAKGLHYLGSLLRHPGREFHVLDLVTMEEGASPSWSARRRDREEQLHGGRSSGSGPFLDEQAKSSYRARLRELEQELDEVTEWADPVRAANLREEMDFLTDELAAAVGLGGRDRQTGSEAERARVNITRAIRSALGRIREHSAGVADHLDSTVHTGTFCSYSPDPRAPISWRG